MRKTFTEFGWIEIAGKFAGISMGFDFCAEHECDISEFKDSFGIPSKSLPDGVEDRTIKQLKYNLEIFNYQTRDKVPAAFLCYSRLPINAIANPDNPFNDESQDMITSWGDDEFLINVRGQENVDRLKILKEAFESRDICLLDKPVPEENFKRSSVQFVFVSSLPDELKNEIKENDQYYIKLEKAVEDSGIKALLKSAGKDWYALCPAWVDRDKKEEIKFFLNPSEQKLHNHGWFTLDELKLWAENKGPVMKI